MFLRMRAARSAGSSTTTFSSGVTLKLEDRFAPALYDALSEAGHAVERVAPFTSMMGHAGALVRHENGLIEGAADPRSDGGVAGF